MSAWSPHGEGLTLVVRVTPRSSRAVLERGRDGVFAARVTAPPVDGAANTAVVALVAAMFGVSRGRVSIVGGETARNKRLRIVGDTAALAERAAALYGAAP